MSQWPLIASVAGLAAIFGGWRRAGRGRDAATSSLLTAYACGKTLVKEGWSEAGASPNHVCVYLDRDGVRIALTVAAAPKCTVHHLRDVIEILRHARSAAGREYVVVHTGALEAGAEDLAASANVTLITPAGLTALTQALAASAAVRAAHQETERTALTRRYDPPEPAVLHAVPQGEVPAPPADGQARGAVKAQQVLQTDRVSTYFADRGGDLLLISFTNQWHRHDGQGYFADGLAGRLGLSVLAFAAREPNWYPLDDMAALLPAALALISGRFPVRVVIGHSQGGYGAIKYAKALDASAVLAFAPQWAIDPKLISDGRVNRHYAGHLHAGGAIAAGDASGTVYVIHDPHDDADAEHARHIAQAVGAVPILVPHAGHASERGLLIPEVFPALLDRALRGDAAGLQALAGQQRRARGERDVHIALRLAQTRPAWALRLLRGRGQAWRATTQAAVAYRIAKAGAAADVLEDALALAAAHPQDAELHFTAGLIAMAADALDQAERLLDLALQAHPHERKYRDARARLANRLSALAEEQAAD